MLSSQRPEWQLQFGVTRMLSSSHLFCQKYIIEGVIAGAVKG